MTRRGTQRLAALCWTLLLIAGVPAALVRIAGSPLPHHRPLTWPSHDDIASWLTRPLDRTALATGTLALGWLAWAGFTAFVLADAATCLARIRLPRLARLARLRVPSPLRMITGGLFGVTAVTTISSPVAVHASVTVDEPATATGHGSHPEAANSPTPAPTTNNNTNGRAARDQPSTAVPAAATTSTAQPPQPPSADNTPPQSAANRYVVRPGDTLSAIADTQLGSPTRWPEICQLNWQRHFPTVGGTLDDCDLIYPRWDLRLPTDAKPPTTATPATPPAGPPATGPQPDTTNTEQPAVTPSTRTPAPTDPGDRLACTQPPPTAPSAAATPVGPGIAKTPLTTPTPPAHSASDPPPSATTSATPDHTTDTDDTRAHPSDEHGVHLPGGSFVPWTLAAAIVAAAAMVWLQRRRHFVPGEIPGEISREQDANDEPPQLPPPVAELHRQVARNPDLPTPTDLADRAATVPTLPLLPPGGIGLIGDGAHAAARAALVTTLASGGPREPDHRGEVVIDATTLTTLIGADAAALGPWPRLHIADNIDHALSILDARLLHRARVLDEHSLTNLDSLREQAPDEEALPPMLLICQTPPPGARMRARVSVGLGNGLDASALLLGQWPHGPTITVSTDGHTHVLDGPATESIGERVAVLDTADAVAILTTLREAHTGEPPNPVPHTPAEPRPSAPAAEPGSTPIAANQPITGQDEPEPTEPAEPPLDAASPPADGTPRAKVTLRVLGAPTIEDVTLPGRNLRGRAAELAVYLACHPDGADTETIAEYLVPDVRRRQAKQLVHTNASNLRHVLGRAGGPITGGYVLKRGATARYRLDPTTISVDLWRLRDLLNRARLASAPTRTALLREACDLYTAPLADGCDYEWVEPHREKTRQWGIEAHLLLADDLLTSDPQASCDLLDKAIGLDRYNEELYRKAMHTRHALHDADGIRTLLHALTNALADLDAEPAETTIELATQLRASLKQQ
jgi:DNA-binding SARP family transcriptional activator